MAIDISKGAIEALRSIEDKWKDYDGHDMRRSTYLKEVAEARKLVVSVPSISTLQIDIDDHDSLVAFHRSLTTLTKVLKPIEITWSYSQSCFDSVAAEEPITDLLIHCKLHIHILCNREFKPLQRVMFQAMLGSDRMREALSYWRIKNKDRDPSLLVEHPNAKRHRIEKLYQLLLNDLLKERGFSVTEVTERDPKPRERPPAPKVSRSTKKRKLSH